LESYANVEDTESNEGYYRTNGKTLGSLTGGVFPFQRGKISHVVRNDTRALRDGRSCWGHIGIVRWFWRRRPRSR